MKLFDNTSFFVMLIAEIFKDIKYFVILLLLTILTFGAPLVFLQYGFNEDKDLVNKVFDFWPMNVLLSQYILSLGDYDLDNFEDSPFTYSCYFYFFCATFISQIMMLNMLIAIMGDSFERVIENRQINGIRTKLEILTDYSALAFSDAGSASLNKEKMFMFIARPVDEEEEYDEWQGVIG